MRRAGIICDLEYYRHNSFKNYFYAIDHLYHGVKMVFNVEDLEYIDILFIGDDHYGYHWNVFEESGILDICCDKDIPVVVFTTERVFNSVFPWNEERFNKLQKVKNLFHYMTDVDDCIKTGRKLNRTLPSKHFINPKQAEIEDKLDKVVFIGRTEGYNDCYKHRKVMLEETKKVIEVDIIDSTIESWVEYMKVVSRYRFILCPKGNCNAFSLRFYDALLVHSIPIQEVEDNTLEYFDVEGSFEDCIFFRDAEELPQKIKECTLRSSHSEFWMEDYLHKILTEDGLL